MYPPDRQVQSSSVKANHMYDGSQGERADSVILVSFCALQRGKAKTQWADTKDRRNQHSRGTKY